MKIYSFNGIVAYILGYKKWFLKGNQINEIFLGFYFTQPNTVFAVVMRSFMK